MSFGLVAEIVTSLAFRFGLEAVSFLKSWTMKFIDNRRVVGVDGF